MPQDGQAKQDCEQRAGQRWISKHAKVVAPHQVTLLGDDLYSKQPFCALALQQGFHFILTRKPDSHTTLYERLAFWQANTVLPRLNAAVGMAASRRMRYRYINDVRLRAGDDALSANWFELTIVSAKTGNNSITTASHNHRLHAQRRNSRKRAVALKSTKNNCSNQGYHLSTTLACQQYLSAFLLSLNLLSFRSIRM